MKRPNVAKLESQISAWNAAYPVGTSVDVKKDLGNIVHTKTRSEAWLLSGHTAVVMVDGITGCYLLDRVTATTQPVSA